MGDSPPSPACESQGLDLMGWGVTTSHLVWRNLKDQALIWTWCSTRSWGMFGAPLDWHLMQLVPNHISVLGGTPQWLRAVQGRWGWAKDPSGEFSRLKREHRHNQGLHDASSKEDFEEQRVPVGKQSGWQGFSPTGESGSQLWLRQAACQADTSRVRYLVWEESWQTRPLIPMQF